MNTTPQRLYDWTDKYRFWNGFEFVWKRGPMSWIARVIHEWVYANFDIIPF